MAPENVLKLAKSKFKSLLLAGLFVGALSFLAIVLTQKNFKSHMDLLVVQNQQGFSDYYALSKSADYLSGVLMESVYSEKFLDEALASNNMSSSFLPSDKIERLKSWQKMVKVTKNSNVGIINIEVFGNSQKQTSEVSTAVLDVLTNKSNLFLGNGQDIEIRVLSGPMVEKNPTVSEIIVVIAGGFAVGIVLMFIWIFYSETPGNRKKEIVFTDSLSNHGSL